MTRDAVTSGDESETAGDRPTRRDPRARGGPPERDVAHSFWVRGERGVYNIRLAARVEINRAKIEEYKSVARRRRPLASSTSSPTKLLNGAARLPAVGGDARA